MKKIASTLLSAVAGATFASQVSAQDLTPYECVPPTEKSIAEQWKKSEERASLGDNSSDSFKASKARISRGQAYVALMDSFWANAEKGVKAHQPANTAEILDLVQDAYIKAAAATAPQMKAKKVESALEIGSFSRTGNVFLNADDLKKGKLSENPGVAKIFTAGPDSRYDSGVDIQIVFKPKGSSDFVMMRLAEGVTAGFKDTSLKSDPVVFNGLVDGSYNFKSEVNLKDHIACRPAPNNP